MIKKFIFGAPFDTGAVVEKISDEKTAMPFFSVNEGEEIELVCSLSENDIVYGLGEAVRGLNKRGWLYKSNNIDDCLHTENKNSLYGSHNFLIVDGKTTFGVFVDFPSLVTFDVGYSNKNTLKITVSGVDAAIYIIEEPSAEAIAERFRKAIGESYTPPLWAFGYQQSRWSYENEDAVRAVVDGFRNNDLPIDAVYLDIDYMERYKDFTVSDERFPRFPEFCAEMKSRDIHLVPIIDAGVKIEDGYDIFEEGRANGYFCKTEDGRDFVAGVWPGRTHFPDFLNKKAAEWFGDKYSRLIDAGIDGFWTDMNEPAIFYSDEGLQNAYKEYEGIDKERLDINEFWRLQGIFNNVKNSPEDYSRFYHNVDGEKIRHDRLHNLYGYMMTRSVAEAFKRNYPNKQMLLFSRSSYIGMHRYAGIWTGDNCSWWSHLLLNIKMLPSLNMCGFIYVGADLGGFGDNTSRELLLRWLSFGLFAPLMRNHSAIGTARQEPYGFSDVEAFGNILKLRYRLIPFIYSEYMNAVRNGKMYFRPLAFAYPNDETARKIEDQPIIGGIMLCPIYEQNAVWRYVYLPEEMLFVRYGENGAIYTEKMDKGVHIVYAKENEVPFFLRKNSVLPLAEAARSTEKLNFRQLKLLCFVEKNAEVCYNLYIDCAAEKNDGNPHRITVKGSADGAPEVISDGGVEIVSVIS